jgi:hypothetical protein
VRLAIEGMKGVLGALEGAVPEQVLRDFHQVVANLQLAYASAADSSEVEEKDE